MFQQIYNEIYLYHFLSCTYGSPKWQLRYHISHAPYFLRKEFTKPDEHNDHWSNIHIQYYICDHIVIKYTLIKHTYTLIWWAIVYIRPRVHLNDFSFVSRDDARKALKLLHIHLHLEWFLSFPNFVAYTIRILDLSPFSKICVIPIQQKIYIYRIYIFLATTITTCILHIT